MHVRRAKRAFTLVELLIVIVIIAILAGMMLMSIGSTTDSAQAMRLVNNLRTLKAATMMYRAQYGEWPVAGNGQATGSAVTDKIQEYFDRDLSATEYGNCVIMETNWVTNDSSFWIGFLLVNGGQFQNGTRLTKGVAEKLAKMAPEIGLFGSNNGEYYAGPSSQAILMKLN